MGLWPLNGLVAAGGVCFGAVFAQGCAAMQLQLHGSDHVVLL